MHAHDSSNKLLAQLREMQASDEAVFDKQAWLEQHEPGIRVRLEQLENNQADIDQLLAEFLKERQELELKYEALLGPCYQVRMDIVAGEDSHEVCVPREGIPGFWLKVLQSHPEIEARISEKDSIILQHLVGVTGSRSFPGQGDDASYGFTLKFFFTPNEHFAEAELSLKVAFADEEETIVKSIQGSDISWKSSGVNPTIKFKKKVVAKGHHKVKFEAVESFFELFNPVSPPNEGSIDFHEYEVMKQEAENCLAIAMILVEDMIPYATKYFSGEKSFEVECDSSTDYDQVGALEDADDDDGDDGDGIGDCNHNASTIRAPRDNASSNSQECKQQ